MPKKKLPQGFQSWIQFHDYLKATKPELFRAKTIRFMQYIPNGGVREAYSISIVALQKLCWVEIDRFRLLPEETVEALSAIIYGSAAVESKMKARELLDKLRINNFK